MKTFQSLYNINITRLNLYGTFYEWFSRSKNGDFSLVDKSCSGHSASRTNENVEKIQEAINDGQTMDETAELTGVPWSTYHQRILSQTS